MGRPSVMPAAVQECTIVGTAGADLLSGTRGGDVICGRGGNDVIRGRGGHDLIRGGTGADQVYGGPGNDRLVGEVGRDFLDGGLDSDLVSGGDGVDSCVHDNIDGDVLRSCVFDREVPSIVSLEVDKPSVDVTTGAQTVTLRARLKDDAGVYRPQSYLDDQTVPGAELWQDWWTLVSGTRRDGWWEYQQVIPRGYPGTTVDLQLSVVDVAERAATDSSLSLTVLDAAPDPAFPEARLQAPAAGSVVDVRDGPRDVVIRARMLDPDTGVAPGSVSLCLAALGAAGPQYRCATDTSRVSGTVHDGIWKGTMRLGTALHSGDWTAVVHASDRARPDAYIEHLSAPMLALEFDWWGGSYDLPLAAGAGSFALVSDVADAAPEVDSFTLAPTTVVRQPSGIDPASVTVEAHDALGSPVDRVRALFVRLGQGQQTRYAKAVTLTRTSGTASDGLWTGQVSMPPSSPVGDYAVVIEVRDASHVRWYAGSSGAGVIPHPIVALAEDPILTIR